MRSGIALVLGHCVNHYHYCWQVIVETHVENTIGCSLCGTIIDAVPVDPLSPLRWSTCEQILVHVSGFVQIAVGQKMVDYRTGWVFHECSAEALREKLMGDVV